MLNLIVVQTSPNHIDELYRNKRIDRDIVPTNNDHGGYFLLKCENQSALAVAIDDELHLASVPNDVAFQGARPYDAPQTCLFHSMRTFDLTVCLGLAGSGKTYLAMCYALHRLFKDNMKIVLLKPTIFIGQKSQAIGAVPGDKREKLEPYIASYMGHLHKILGKSADHFLFQWEEERKFEIEAIELCRGRHFENSIVIVDECQNLNLHEILSLVSRVADDSQLILLGDPRQIDTGQRWHETGVAQLCKSDAFYNSAYAQGIMLEKTYRGVLAELVDDVMDEVMGTLGEEEERLGG